MICHVVFKLLINYPHEKNYEKKVCIMKKKPLSPEIRRLLQTYSSHSLDENSLLECKKNEMRSYLTLINLKLSGNETMCNNEDDSVTRLLMQLVDDSK